MYLSLGFYALLAVVHQTLATAVHGHHRDAFRAGRRQEDGSSPQEPLFTYDELWDLQIKYLDNFVYPANVVQAMSVNSTLFAEDVEGRIDITQTFDGRELNTEYIFGLFSNIAANSGALSVLGYAIDYEVLQFSANDRVTTTTTRFTFDFPSLGVKAPVMWNSWHVYNAQGEITAYDATLRWWEWALDELIHARYVSLYTCFARV